MKLKKKNNTLLEDLKRFNNELSTKIANRADISKHDLSEENIGNEIDCLKKMMIVYEKELILLRSKERVNTGPERIVELQVKYQESQKSQEEILKRIKELEKKTKEMDKAFKKHQESNEDNAIKVEVII